MKNNQVRSFDVLVGTRAGRSVHHVLAESSMAAFQVAVRRLVEDGPLLSLVIKPRVG